MKITKEELGANLRGFYSNFEKNYTQCYHYETELQLKLLAAQLAYTTTALLMLLDGNTE